MKQPQRVYGSPKTNSVFHIWLSKCKHANAQVLKNGENPSDYPDKAVAFETLNFGWIWSAPIAGQRHLIEKF